LLIFAAPVLMAVTVTSECRGSSVAQFVNDSSVLNLIRPTTTVNTGKNCMWLIL